MTSPATGHPLVGKTIASVTVRDMVGRDTYKDVITFTATTITFTDGATHTYSDSDQDVYDATERTTANECACGATAHNLQCNECGNYRPFVAAVGRL
ncbi:hypothetical protein [Tessaracoccus sp.]